MKNNPVIVEKTFNAPIEEVWEALTDKEKMKQWYFDIVDFKPKISHEFHFLAGPENKQYLHICRITDLFPLKKLAYTWRFEGYDGNSKVNFELFNEGPSSTRLKLTHEGLESFPASNPDLAKENFEQGWNQIIGTSLVNFLSKDEA
ncbi:SRPBCC domain-containing protein [Solitalea longa]|uniref:SRPBCC domain-containing protein n=1 Tax=Solitalea longa TaxID=2079460 RepID=A0A2S5A720_9SPHI|nr:SRPBCC domain-containing protein [Solitalea longa]POY38306.1 SRPBCC domain-containing protein [Solitalea longa]